MTPADSSMGFRNRLELRKFRWISSENGNSEQLHGLAAAMKAFYEEQATRHKYQEMVDCPDSHQPQTEAALIAALLARNPSDVLEIGCGSGRMYRRLVDSGYRGNYTGADVPLEIMQMNRQQHPEASWICSPICSLSIPGVQFDVVFAYFVLEHFVYPARALESMLGFVRSNGSLLLVFPDFVEMGRFGSQTLGLKDGRAHDLLKRGRFLNAIVTLYDSRIRLPRALRKALMDNGPFPVNLQPRCLCGPAQMEADMDAIYIASKRELKEWAEKRGLVATYPTGVTGNFRENALMEIRRSVEQ